MNEINKTIEKRTETYGDFTEISKISQRLLDTITTASNYDKLSYVHKEAYKMIFHKIARSVCGDCYILDTAHDIVGYATLLETYLRNEK